MIENMNVGIIWHYLIVGIVTIRGISLNLALCSTALPPNALKQLIYITFDAKPPQPLSLHSFCSTVWASGMINSPQSAKIAVPRRI